MNRQDICHNMLRTSQAFALHHGVIRHCVWLVMAGTLFYFLSATDSVHAASQTESLRFQTTGQPLFKGDDLQRHRFEIRFIDEHEPGKPLGGEIRHLPQELPVSTLQTIWQRAIDGCTSNKYTISAIDLTITPTQAECINGQIRRNYCIAPPQLGWDFCLNVGDNRRTYIRDLGPGVGPMPTQPATQDYEIGYIVTYSSDLVIGMDGGFILDPGSVDITFDARATLTSDVDSALPGDTVRLTTAHIPQGDYTMISRAPNIDMSLGSFMDAREKIDLEWASVDFKDGRQMRDTMEVYRTDSVHTPFGYIDLTLGFVRFMNGEWFGINISPAGVDIRLAGDTLPLFTDKVLKKELVVPDILPIPGKPSFPFADLAILTPELDTPAITGFDCGVCIPLREFVDADGLIHNTTPTGQRTLLGGITDGTRFTLPFVNDGYQDADLFRFDLDADVISLLWGVPLGVVVDGPVLMNKSGKPVPGITVEVNALDFDIASFWSFDQSLSFDPGLHVELQFSKPTRMRGPADADFNLATSLLVRVGDGVDFIQPEGGVEVTPVYTLRRNQFVNDTRLLVTPAIQLTLAQLKLSGLIPDLAPFPTNLVALQWTPELHDPAHIWSSNTTPVALDGFGDIKGRSLMVAEETSNTSGGGGGGMLSVPMLLGLIGLWWLQRQRAG